MSTIVIYHNDCPDGIMALACVLRAIPDAIPYAGRYDEQPDYDRLRGHDVIIVDFSWKRQAMMRIQAEARTLFVLDHHKSAEAELAGLQGCVFDMHRSGAGMAWDCFVGGPRHWVIDYTEDRDLWRFQLPDSVAINEAMAARPLTLESLQALLSVPEPSELIAEGRAICRYVDLLIAAGVKHKPRNVIAGHSVPVVACPFPQLISRMGNELSKGEPFAATWVEKDDGGKLYSLRSASDGLDVSEIAKQYGGGGHKHAAGFHLASGLSLSEGEHAP